MHIHESAFFGAFLLFFIVVLLIDLGLFNRKSHTVGFREACIWLGIWISLALGFYLFLYFSGDVLHGVQDSVHLEKITSLYRQDIAMSGNFAQDITSYNHHIALEFLTGYLIEYALSVDNVFVMIMIFMSFRIAPKYYKRVLFWGILGAVIMRFLFIFISSALLQEFSWVMFVFGGLLIFTGIRMLFHKEKEGILDTSGHPVVKIASKYFRVDRSYSGHRFFLRKDGKLMLTPLFLVLMVIEFSDVIFAVDSVPAIFSVTQDPFIVFFSNMFAIIGLRSLFFIVMGVIDTFHYLKTGLGVLLFVIGLKMIFAEWLKEVGFGTEHSLMIIGVILGLSILASLIFPKKKQAN
ncbi:MAG: TerC/Alx family metal homeostasis membrane protein [Bacteroidetes bacterium]|nr:TerC/Alx family metal homeostasis membrane protein [Bacteroidota bacterium]MBU1719502.1 TerC/Alx family metal homeostasis membrane protein [Bacteroidota bacterium]